MVTLVPNFDLAKLIGVDRMELEATTVGELIEKATAQYGNAMRDALSSVSIVVNGRSINYLRGKNTRLESGDAVWMVRPSAGG